MIKYSCEGKCLRSFHAFKEVGSNCKTLGYTRAEVKVCIFPEFPFLSYSFHFCVVNAVELHRPSKIISVGIAVLKNINAFRVGNWVPPVCQILRSTQFSIIIIIFYLIVFQIFLLVLLISFISH